MELWQKAIVSTIFGIQDAEKIRVFREIFIVIGRKNGKSLFASALIAYMAYLEPEYGQEIYCLAPKLDQAALVYDGFYQMVQAEEELEELAKKRRSDIYIAESNTVIKPIAFNAKKSDGFNPQLVVCDEMAAWSGDAGLKQYEVMKSALGARKQPMILSISTAGYINDSIYDELMKRSTSFLKGNSKERRLLPFLYMIDDVEKWNDIDELKKANPNMGVSVKESFFIDEIAVAEGSLSKKAEFLTKYCNIKQNSSIAWLEYQTVEKAEILKTLEDFRECYAVGGIDLSQTTDLTAASVVIEKEGVLYAFTQFFMPKNRLETLQATDGVPYDIFVKKGIITLSGDNYVNYKDVFNWYVWLLETYGIRVLKIGYDRYSAQYLVDDLKNYGFHTDDVYQGENLTPVIREFEGVLKDGDFKIANNKLLQSHFLNVALKHNMETRKFRPIKIEQRAHIDARAVEAGCANNNIGYGQGDRNTLNTEAKKVNYDLSKVGLCNTDCSEFQNVCAVASGAAGVTHGSNGWTTATMRNALKAAGYKIITDSAFLKNENYCVRGAIYVKESSHTVCGLTNGTYAAQTLAKAGIGGYAGNNNYSGKGIGTAVAKCDMNIRSVAEVKSNTVYSSIKAGTKVEVLEVLANGWYKIVWAGASCGYAYTSNTNNKYYTYTANSKNNSTSTSGSSGLKQTQKPESALCFDKTLAGAYVVTADKLHMRAGAGKTKADYGTIAEGGKVHCYGYYNKEKGTGAKWLYVACGNVTGYCHSDYLKRA